MDPFESHFSFDDEPHFRQQQQQQQYEEEELLLEESNRDNFEPVDIVGRCHRFKSPNDDDDDSDDLVSSGSTAGGQRGKDFGGRTSCQVVSHLPTRTSFCDSRSLQRQQEQQEQKMQYVERVIGESPINKDILNVKPFISCLPALDFTAVIVNMIRHYASEVFVWLLYHHRLMAHHSFCQYLVCLAEICGDISNVY